MDPGKTYLLRIINAALNDELFLAIANHSLTVVEVDAVYVKPFQTDTLVITPGQTTNVLFTANATVNNGGVKQFYKQLAHLLRVVEHLITPLLQGL